MPDWKSLLAQHGPRLALGLIASKQGGPQAHGALLEGLREAEFRQQQLQRQQQMDHQAEVDRAFPREMMPSARAFQRENTTADNARLDTAMQQRQRDQAIALILGQAQQQAETATDPEQAQNALSQVAQNIGGLYGVDPQQLTGIVPSVAPQISARKKKLAQELYDRAEKRYGAEAIAGDSITLQTEAFGEVKPSQLRALFEAPAIGPQGAPVAPMLPPSPTQILDLGGKKVVVDPRQLRPGQTFTDVPGPSTATKADEPLVAILGPDGAPVLVPRSRAVGQRPASTREQGRPVQSGDANRIIDLDTSLNDLNTLERELGQTGAASKIGAMLPNAVTEFTGWGSDAKQRQAVIDRVKQVIGKALEGGVLRKEDEYKYVKILPTIGDPPEVAAKKVAGLRTAIQQRKAATLEGLADANFDTSKFESRGAKADPLGIR